MYNARITQQNKGAIIILIDQSGSMDDECLLNGQRTSKARAVAHIANAFIDEIINNCHRRAGVCDYFDIAVIGYGGDEAKSLLGKSFSHITDIDSMHVPIEHYHIYHKLPTGNSVSFPFDQRQWIAPTAKGRTPMGAALRMARTMSAAWCRKHPASFPPIVINISDGEATDASQDELLGLADRLKAVGTDDGNLLFFNLHITSNSDVEQSLKWPTTSEPLPFLRHAKLLFDMSSTLPSLYASDIADDKGHTTPQEYRAVCYNSSCDELISAMNIGTSSLLQMI